VKLAARRNTDGVCLRLSGFHDPEALRESDGDGVLVGITTRGGIGAVVADDRRFELEGARRTLTLSGGPRPGGVGTEGA